MTIPTSRREWDARDDATQTIPVPVVPRSEPAETSTSYLHPRHRIILLVKLTIASIRQDRVFGLGAEVAFWAVFSMAPLLLAVFGAVGYLQPIIGAEAISDIHHNILRAAGAVLTPNAVSTVVDPLVRGMLARGHPGVISIGFAVALWSGSTAMSAYTNTVIVAYEARGVRSWWRTRLLALGLYLGGLAAGIIVLPLVIVGPGALASLAHGNVHSDIDQVIHIAYWPVVGLLSVWVVALFYGLAVPVDIPWRKRLPGAVLAILLWLAGSLGLRYYWTSDFHHTSVYGSLASIVATMLFCYVTALAVLIGAEFNSEVDVLWPEHARGSARQKLRARA